MVACMMLIDGQDIKEVILPTEVSGLEAAPATLELAGQK